MIQNTPNTALLTTKHQRQNLDVKKPDSKPKLLSTKPRVICKESFPVSCSGRWPRKKPLLYRYNLVHGWFPIYWNALGASPSGPMY